MAPTNKANYKSFEAQARLVRAIVAAHPDTKWNYKDIVACYGSDMTEAALNHRFRRLRAEAMIVTEGRKQKLDMKDLPVSEDLPKVQGNVDVQNISKYFGQSTADGIQFQFRGIKKDANALRDAAKAGKQLSNQELPYLNGTSGGGSGSVMSTPSKPTPQKPSASKSTGRVNKRKAPQPIKHEIVSDDEDEDADESTQDWSEIEAADDTPTRKRAKTTNVASGQNNGTTSRRSVAGSFGGSFADHDPPTTVAPTSIFGNPTPTAHPGMGAAFSAGGMDSLIGGGDSEIFGSSFSMLHHYDLGDLGMDGEI